MAPTLAEKESFYAELAHLDTLDDASENTLLKSGPALPKLAAAPGSTALKRKHSATQSRHQQLKQPLRRTEEVIDRPPSFHTASSVEARLGPPSSSYPPAPTVSQSEHPQDPLVEANEIEQTATSSQSRRQIAPLRHSPSYITHSITNQAEAPPTLRRTQSEATKHKGKAPKKKKGPIIPVEQQIFCGLCFFYIPNKDDHPIRKMRMEYAEAHGSLRARVFGEEVTHIIVDETFAAESAVKEFANLQWPPGIPAVKINWLVESMNTKVLQNSDSSRFCVEGRTDTRVREEAPPVVQPNLAASSKDVPMSIDTGRDDGDPGDVAQQEPSGIPAGQALIPDELANIIQEVQTQSEVPLSFLAEDGSIDPDPDYETAHVPAAADAENKGFQCMKKNVADTTGPNAQTISVLQKMATCHDQVNDEWRIRAYRMAIAALGKEPNFIQTREEALKLRGVGARLADKIAEIVASGGLRQLELTMSDPMLQLLRLFMGIYGAGRSQAHRWISQGHRSLKDLKKNAQLSPNQRIGIDHYDDFASRVPRGEVEQHASIVREAIREIDDELELVVGGSYRRGQADSGDIDVLITKKSAGKELIRTLVLDAVVPKLMSSGFLKASLATGRSDEETSKWHGASALPESPVWRRLDLLFVPGDEIGAALIYWTGNDIFNRSIRLLASRKGMRLNQHGLFKDVMRGRSREKVTEGELVESKSEEEIFRHLRVPWRPAEHRRC